VKFETMGPNKKGYNWKARQVVKTKIIKAEGVSNTVRF
jgi:hypothetical protein